MLETRFYDRPNTIYMLEANCSLTIGDLLQARNVINQHLAVKGSLRAFIIKLRDTTSYALLLEYIDNLKLLRNEHEKVPHVAILLDINHAKPFDQLSSHFSNAKIRAFSTTELSAVHKWILNDYDY